MFLHYELKMDRDTVEILLIEDIFTPTNPDLWCLFVTFKHLSSVTRIYERTRCMRKESRIINYIPPQYEDRGNNIKNIEKTLREEGRYQTRVKMGVLDLELSKKDRGGSGKWERVPLPKGMAEPNISESRGAGGMSTSPAPGRP